MRRSPIVNRSEKAPGRSSGALFKRDVRFAALIAGTALLCLSISCTRNSRGEWVQEEPAQPGLGSVRSALEIEDPIIDEFQAGELDAAWRTYDGFALAYPSAQDPNNTAEHARFEVTDDHFHIHIPAGSRAHNQWDLEHAAILREYPGSGVYTAKMDGTVNDYQQFGLTFESSPGTFIQFMLYTDNTGGIKYYAEQFANINAVQHKNTLPISGFTEVSIPQQGPFFLRVTLTDDEAPEERHWKWEYSFDGRVWRLAMAGHLEGASPGNNIGQIRDVGVFAGSQQDNLVNPFDAAFDYFKASPLPDFVLQPPVLVIAAAGSAKVTLAWQEVEGAEGYHVLRSSNENGPYTWVGTTDELLFSDETVENGTSYFYVVSAFTEDQVAENSEEVSATPEQNPAPLEPPENLSATAGDGSVQLSWEIATNATSYQVFRASKTGGPYERLATATSLGYLDGEVANGEDYYYVVTAVNPDQESEQSHEVHVVPGPYRAPNVPEKGLQLLLDADSLIGHVDNLKSIENWRDASGTENDARAETVGQAPHLQFAQLNGRPGAYFDGVDDYLNLDGSFEDFGAGLTAFVVVKPEKIATGVKFLSLGNGPEEENIVLGRKGDDAGALQFFTNDAEGAVSDFDTRSTLEPGKLGVYAVWLAAAAPNERTQAVVTSSGIVVGRGEVFSPPARERSLNYFGRSYWGDGLFQGHLGALIVYARELTAEEFANVSNLLNERYQAGGTIEEFQLEGAMNGSGQPEPGSEDASASNAPSGTDPEEPLVRRGCGCRAGAHPHEAANWLPLLVLAAAVRRRRSALAPGTIQ